MANNLLDISMITNETLAVLDNDICMAARVVRQYDDKFAVAGAKVGYTINARKPARFRGTLGPALGVEDFNETSVPVTLTTQFHVDTQFTTADLALALDEFSNRVIKPSVAAVANRIDTDVALMAFQQTANAVGTPGVLPTTALGWLQAGALLDSEGANRDSGRQAVLDPWTQAGIVDSLKGLFNPQDKLSSQYSKGLMGKNTLGFDWYLDQNMATYTVGAQGGAPLFTTTGTSSALISTGWASGGTLQTSGWTAAAAPRLNVGDIFTIAGVFAVNPQNRKAYGSNRLRQFVVRPLLAPSLGTFAPAFDLDGVTVIGGTFSSSGAGTLQIQISPAVISGGQFQNVSAAPANNAVITVLGAAGVVSPQNMVFHKSAFTLVMADLELPEGVHFAGRASDPYAGMSVRIVRQYTINNDAIPCRFDVLYGAAPLYPELSVRVPA